MSRNSSSNVTITGDVTGDNISIITDSGSATVNGRQLGDGTHDLGNGTTITVSRDSKRR